MKFDLKRVNWYSVLSGVVVLLFFSPFLQMQVDFYTHSAVAVGEVTKLNHGGHHPEVEFTASNGNRISFRGHAFFSVAVGDRVGVRYQKDDPKLDPQVDEIMNLFTFEPIIVAIVFIVAGLRGKSVSRLS